LFGNLLLEMDYENIYIDMVLDINLHMSIFHTSIDAIYICSNGSLLGMDHNINVVPMSLFYKDR